MECIGGRVNNVEIKETKTGKSLLTFSVAENKGWGDTKTTTWYDCTSWDTGISLSKGAQVLVFGHASVREYKDKTYNQFETFHVEVLAASTGATTDAPKPAVAVKKEAIPF